MSSYIGRHAELYDVLYAAKDYNAEVEFIHECLVKYGNPLPGKILEIACGTGNHSFFLENLGYKIHALDSSSDMIMQARKKAESRSSGIQFSISDMRDPSVFNEKYNSVLCLFDSIGYVQTNDSIKQVFSNVSNSLLPNGLFIMEFWHAAAMIKNYDPLRIKRFKLDNGSELLRISETTMNIEKQLCSVKYTLYEFQADNKYEFLEETQVNRFFLAGEMHSLLEGSGLEPLAMYNGFSGSTLIDENTFHVVMICKKI